MERVIGRLLISIQELVNNMEGDWRTKAAEVSSLAKDLDDSATLEEFLSWFDDQEAS